MVGRKTKETMTEMKRKKDKRRMMTGREERGRIVLFKAGRGPKALFFE